MKQEKLKKEKNKINKKGKDTISFNFEEKLKRIMKKNDFKKPKQSKKMNAKNHKSDVTQSIEKRLRIVERLKINKI